MSTEILELVKIAVTGIVALVVRGVIAGVVSYFKSDAYKAKLLSKVAKLFQKMGVDLDIDKILNNEDDEKNDN